MERRYIGALALLLVGYTAGSCVPTDPAGSAGSNQIVHAAALVNNPAGVTIVNSGTPAQWTALPSATAMVNVDSAPASIIIRFWGSVACFGTGNNKYVRATLDGVELATAPLAALPSQTSGQSEISVSLQASRPVAVGSHNVAVDVRVEAGSSCFIAKDYWHFEVDVVSA